MIMKRKKMKRGNAVSLGFTGIVQHTSKDHWKWPWLFKCKYNVKLCVYLLVKIRTMQNIFLCWIHLSMPSLFVLYFVCSC